MAAREEELEAELERERDSYLRELVSTLEEIESLVLDLSGANGDAEQTRSLARQIHTIKGTAGSLGLDLLSLAAHRMEDLLASERPGQDGDDKFIDRLLAQNDLLTSIAEAYLDDNARFLDNLRCQGGVRRCGAARGCETRSAFGSRIDCRAVRRHAAVLR